MTRAPRGSRRAASPDLRPRYEVLVVREDGPQYLARTDIPKDAARNYASSLSDVIKGVVLVRAITRTNGRVIVAWYRNGKKVKG